MAYRVTYLLIKQHYLARGTWLPAYLQQLFTGRPATDSAASDERDNPWRLHPMLVDGGVKKACFAVSVQAQPAH